MNVMTHLCLPLQSHPMIADHSLQPFSKLERDGRHHKTLVGHKLRLAFLPSGDLPDGGSQVKTWTTLKQSNLYSAFTPSMTFWSFLYFGSG